MFEISYDRESYLISFKYLPEEINLPSFCRIILTFFHISMKCELQLQKKKNPFKLGLMAHIYKPSTWEARSHDNHKFRAGLRYILRLCLKTRP